YPVLAGARVAHALIGIRVPGSRRAPDPFSVRRFDRQRQHASTERRPNHDIRCAVTSRVLEELGCVIEHLPSLALRDTVTGHLTEVPVIELHDVYVETHGAPSSPQARQRSSMHHLVARFGYDERRRYAL